MTAQLADVRPPVHITVHGRPAPQGSKRAFVNQHTGRPALVESSKHVKPWRDSVTAAALEATGLGSGTRRPALAGPLEVVMVFTFARPKSHYRTGRNAHLLRPGAPLAPHGKPDLSKLARSTEDALTDAGVWRDDAQVVCYSRLAKVFAGEDPDALSTPGAVIVVRQAT